MALGNHFYSVLIFKCSKITRRCCKSKVFVHLQLIWCTLRTCPGSADAIHIKLPGGYSFSDIGFIDILLCIMQFPAADLFRRVKHRLFVSICLIYDIMPVASRIFCCKLQGCFHCICACLVLPAFCIKGNFTCCKAVCKVVLSSSEVYYNISVHIFVDFSHRTLCLLNRCKRCSLASVIAVTSPLWVHIKRCLCCCKCHRHQ